MGRRDVHLEVEVKYDLEPSVTAAELLASLDVEGVDEVRDGGTARLTATYYDTPELDLLRHRITLRRRTGGTDGGWHLKLPAGQSGAGTAQGRLEVRRPAGHSRAPVPSELTGLVRSVLRDRVPQPVVRLRTTRVLTLLLDDQGRVLAEIADDQVTAQVLGEQEPSSSTWREVEVELVEGGPQLLAEVGRRLRRQGAVPALHRSKLARGLAGQLPAQPVPNGHRGPRRGAGVGSVVLAHLRAQRDELVACDPQVRLDRYDSVHRMRVATRRLRSALATFRPVFTPGSTTALRSELAWLAGVLGAARDAEVLRDLLADELVQVSDQLLLGPVTERIGTELDEAYRLAHATVVAELDGDRYLQLLAALDAFVAVPPFSRLARRPARRQVPVLVRRDVRRVVRRLDAARAETELEQRQLRSHEVRKAAKRARYAAEAVGELFGAPARSLARQMRTVQQALGSHQDSLLARDWLLGAADRARDAGEPTFSYGLLYARQACGEGDTDANLVATADLLSPSTLSWPPRALRR